MNSQIELDEYNSFQSLLSRYRRALSLIEESGVRVAGSCRLRVYEQRLAKLIADPRPAVEAELVFASVFDLREIDEVIEIVEYLPKPLDAATLDLLTKLVGGNENPDNAAHATAREAQYELYLGAVFRRTGVHARHGAPDLVTPWQNEDFFLEAKRPTSSKRLDDDYVPRCTKLENFPARE